MKLRVYYVGEVSMKLCGIVYHGEECGFGKLVMRVETTK